MLKFQHRSAKTAGDMTRVTDKPVLSSQRFRLLRAILRCHCCTESGRYPVFCACANGSYA